MQRLPPSESPRQAPPITQLLGKALSAGYAVGKTHHLLTGSDLQVPCYAIAPRALEAELQRFHQAVLVSGVELDEVRQQVLRDLGSAESQVFDAHLAMLHDKQFAQNVQSRIRQKLINVEQALRDEVNDLVRMLGSVESEYIRERCADVKDVGRRVLRQLANLEPSLLSLRLPPGSVLVTVELLPSDVINLDRENVVALVTERGGSTSHAAILARALGIPSVTGIDQVLTAIPDAVQVLVDGNTGGVVVDPDTRDRTAFFRAKDVYDQYSQAAFAAEDEVCMTADGVVVELQANIGQLHEVAQVHLHNLQGVGLFRTEYLFLEATQPPGLDQQQQLYLQAAGDLQGLPMVIRTLDLGGDKKPPFLARLRETNPNLGMRGLRFSLAEPDLFNCQLQAILQAVRQTQSPIDILFPMVTGGEEFLCAKQMVERLARTMGINQLPRVGAMIETPCALFELDSILAAADFLSIGTNDLTQYMLAADRNSVELLESYSMLQPGILRAIAKVLEAASRRQCRVCVCGEVAGAPRIAALLVGFGVRQLSISPIRAARVRYALRQVNIRQLQELAQAALHSTTVKAVRGLLESLTMIVPAN